MESSGTKPRHPLVGFLTRLLEWVVIFAMGVLVADVLWGVLSRMLASWGLLSSQSSWTEELARYLMIWVGLLGASLAFEKGSHLGLDYIVGKLHPTGRRILRVGALLTVLAFTVGVLIYGGWELVSRTLTLQQTAPALGIPKGWVYIAVPLSGVFATIFTVADIVDAVRAPDDRFLESHGDTDK